VSLFRKASAGGRVLTMIRDSDGSPIGHRPESLAGEMDGAGGTLTGSGGGSVGALSGSSARRSLVS
jgi:hypothetical protein